MPSKTRFWIIFFLVLFYGACFKLSLNLDVDEKITSMLPVFDEEVKNFNFILENAPLMDAVYIDIHSEPDHGFSESTAYHGESDGGFSKSTDYKSMDYHATPDDSGSTLQKAADDFYDEIKASPFFQHIVYKISAGEFFNLVDLIHEKKQYLVTPHDLLKIKNKINPDSVSSILTDFKRKLLGLKGMFIAKTIKEDPFNINALVMEKIENLNPMSSKISVENGRITSSHGRHVLMIAYPDFPAVDTLNGKKMLDILKSAKHKIENAGPGINIGFAGAHVASLDNSLTIQKDVKRTIMVLSLAIITMGMFFFSRKIFILLIFFPAFFGLTFSLALLSLFDPHVSGIALGCGAVLVGITVDFGIHLLFHLDASTYMISGKSPPDCTISTGSISHSGRNQVFPLQAMENKNDSTAPSEDNFNFIKSTFKKLYKPLATCAGTTSLALFSLAFSSIPGQRQMGIFSGTAVLAAAFFAAFFLMYFIPGTSIPGTSTKNRRPLLGLVPWCCRMLEKRKKNTRPLTIAAVILCVLSLYGVSKFEFQGDIKELNHLSPEVKKDMDMFLETWGGDRPTVTAVVRGKSIQDALMKNDKLYALLKEQQEKNMIQNISSISPVLPSFNTQKQNHECWKKFWDKGAVDGLKSIMDIEIKKHKFAPDIFAPFYEAIKPGAGENTCLILPKDLNKTAIKELINSRITEYGNDKFLVLTTFESLENTDMEELKKSAGTTIPGTIIFDAKYFTTHITQRVYKEFIKIALIAVFAIFTALFFFMGKIRVVLISLLPVILSGFVTIGVLGLAGISINLISVLFIVFVFGVGVDFSVFMVHQRLTCIDENEKEEMLAVTWASVIVCALTTIAGFTSLLFAHHNALRSIGAAGFTGMVSCLIFSFIIIPSVSKG